MASKEPKNRAGSQMSDVLAGFIDSVARLATIVGGGVLLVGTILLLMNFNVSGAPGVTEQALKNAQSIAPFLLYGAVGVSLGVAWLQWGEETLAPLILIVAAAYYFSPFYVPSIFGSPAPTDASQTVISGLQNAGLALGVVGFIVLTLDVATRARIRAREGARAEQLQYGKGIKEEVDIQNVFLGKCWQLPYCRKFVREKCPIYHARRTCWRERVGCMCEESVIRNAMAGKLVPKDAVAAASMIPYNQSISDEKKIERCRHCVIYNEHQKHKYKLAMPMAILGLGGIYFVFRTQLLEGVAGMVGNLDRLVNNATLNTVNPASNAKGGNFFHEFVLGALMLIVLAYAIRFIEFLIFKLKV
ncbi:MAG: hypothetical protein AB7F50_08775 [Fimbriimonadaceae bacterium]